LGKYSTYPSSTGGELPVCWASNGIMDGEAWPEDTRDGDICPCLKILYVEALVRFMRKPVAKQHSLSLGVSKTYSTFQMKPHCEGQIGRSEPDLNPDNSC
jgi:hypothetical protein